MLPVLKPVILAFSALARLVSRLVGVHISGNNLFITRQQIRRVVEMADKVGHADIFDQVNAYADGAPIHMINPEVRQA